MASRRNGVTKKSRYEDTWQNQTMETSKTDGEIIEYMQARKKALSTAQINDASSDITDPSDSTNEIAPVTAQPIENEGQTASTEVNGTLNTVSKEVHEIVELTANADVMQADIRDFRMPSLEYVKPRKPVMSKSTFTLVVVAAALLSAAVVALTAGFGLIPIAVGVGTVFAVKAAIYGAVSLGAAVTSATALVGMKKAASALVFGSKAEPTSAAKATKPSNNPKNTNTPRAS